MTVATPITVGTVLADAASVLREAGADSPRLDAELLLAAASGIDRAALIARPERPLDSAAVTLFASLLERRRRREPVAYVLRRKGFRRLELEVDSRVLVPRPETELLVEVALERSPTALLDVGTGSGAIALAVADELPDCEVTATDVSPAALEVAAANAERLGFAARVRFLAGSVPARGSWELVVANLPYVADAELAMLEPEVSRHEPALALCGGADGLDPIRGLLAALGGRTRRCGAVALEVGEGQAQAVASLAEAAGFARCSIRRDLAGIERVIVAEADG